MVDVEGAAVKVVKANRGRPASIALRAVRRVLLTRYVGPGYQPEYGDYKRIADDLGVPAYIVQAQAREAGLWARREDAPNARDQRATTIRPIARSTRGGWE